MIRRRFIVRENPGVRNKCFEIYQRSVRLGTAKALSGRRGRGAKP